MISLKDMMNTKRPQSGNDGTLRIDCRQCPDEPDIGSAGCIKCMCSHIDIREPPSDILLRCGSEIRIDGTATDIITGIAEGYYSIPVGRSDKKCSGCVLSAESLESEKWYDLSSENTRELLNRLDCIYVNCPWERECLEDAKRIFGQMNDNLDRITEQAAKDAGRTVGL